MRCSVKEKGNSAMSTFNTLVNHRKITFPQECYWGLNLPGGGRI